MKPKMTPEEAIAVFDKMLKRYDWAEDNKSVQAIKVAKECIKAEIERRKNNLFCKVEIDEETMRSIVKEKVAEFELDIKSIKAEAIKEYRQRLKSKAGDTVLYGHSLVSLATSFVTVKVIDETYDEMVGDAE